MARSHTQRKRKGGVEDILNSKHALKHSGEWWRMRSRHQSPKAPDPKVIHPYISSLLYVNHGKQDPSTYTLSLPLSLSLRKTSDRKLNRLMWSFCGQIILWKKPFNLSNEASFSLFSRAFENEMYFFFQLSLLIFSDPAKKVLQFMWGKEKGFKCELVYGFLFIFS